MCFSFDLRKIKRKPTGLVSRYFWGFPDVPILGFLEPSRTQVKLNKHASRGATGIPLDTNTCANGPGCWESPGCGLPCRWIAPATGYGPYAHFGSLEPNRNPPQPQVRPPSPAEVHPAVGPEPAAEPLDPDLRLVFQQTG